MDKQSARITLKNPCSQDWQGMPQVPGGVYCSQCSKTVIDFTGLTDDELIGFLSKKKPGDTCGKFHNDQLKKVYVLQTSRPQKSFHGIRLMLAGLLTLRLPSEAQIQKLHEQAPITTPQKKAALKTNADINYIKGKITDAGTRRGIVAFINLYADHAGTDLLGSISTDNNGNYTIQLPDTGLSKFFRLTYFSGNYSERHITVDRDKLPAYLPVSLSLPADDDNFIRAVMQSSMHTGGIPDIEFTVDRQNFVKEISVNPHEPAQNAGVKLPFFKRMWQSLKSVFSRPSHQQ